VAGTNILDRLVINLSHDCNLRCRYCYAASGTYGGRRDLLSKETGYAILDFFFSIYERINLIQFFGGEPFLNIPVLDSICEGIKRICEERQIDPPSFTVITNGTILNKKIIDLIRKHKLRITVSLDGPAEIHDKLRVYPDGKGSFNCVTSNIQDMKKETGQPISVEGTFTSHHILHAFSVSDFMDYLVEVLDIHFLHMPPILGRCFDGHGIILTDFNIENLVRIYSQAIHKSIQSLTTGDIKETVLISYVDRYLSRYFAGHVAEPYLCAAGNGTLSVSTTGEIYPCFVFTNAQEYKLGDVNQSNAVLLETNKLKFSGRLRTRDANVDKNRMLFCAGMNYECRGHLSRVSSREIILSKKLHSFMEEEILGCFSNKETEDWIKTKLMLFRLWQDIPEA
jgi:uncharacterized protein